MPQHVQEAQLQGACLQLALARANGWEFIMQQWPLDKQYTTTDQ